MLHVQLMPLTLEDTLLLTGCRKPCYYKEYKLLRERPSRLVTENFYFALLGVSNDILIETEVLVYTWTSLVAEFGGTLGLFLGFSALTVWDGVEKLLHLGKTIIGGGKISTNTLLVKEAI